jgi:hypothetical protein
MQPLTKGEHYIDPIYNIFIACLLLIFILIFQVEKIKAAAMPAQMIRAKT